MTELENPIKINWTGDARQKFRGRKVQARVDDDGPNGEETAATLDRYKTVVSVETTEEAEALESMLGGMVKAGYSWQTENHTKAFRRVLKELREGMDEVETDDETTTFDFESDGSEAEQPDVYVTETFVNKYDDERAKLDGDTYEVFKEAGLSDSLDWDKTHHKFNKPTKEWLVDVDALDYFAEKVEEAGFTFDDGLSAESEKVDSPLYQLHDAVEEGDRITVEYWQKNGEGDNDKAGDVVDVGYESGYDDKPEVAFRRDDGQWMVVRFDKFGKPALFTGGSTSPFVGAVKAVTIDRPIDETEGTDDDDDDADDDTDGPTETATTMIEKRKERRESKLLDSVLEDMGEE